MSRPKWEWTDLHIKRINEMQKFLLVGLVCTLIIFSSMGLGWSQENDFSTGKRIEQLKEELNKLYSLLEEEKREYIRQHPIQIKPSMESGVMWELTKETKGEESYKYLEDYVKYFPDSSKVQDAMWYIMSMAYRGAYLKSESVGIDPFIPLEEYAERFPTDGANVAFAKGCLYYEKINSWFWTYSASELKRKRPELIEESRNEVLEGIEFFKEAINLATPKAKFRGFNTPHFYGWAGPYYYDWGRIRESAYWNIGRGYERLEMWEEAVEIYSFYLLEYPESDEADRAKAKIYLMRQELGQSK